MESSASRRKDVCGTLACRAWIPLEHREAALMMHEVSVCVEKGALPAGLRLRKTRHRKYRGRGFRKGFMARRGSVADEGLCSRRWATQYRHRHRLEAKVRASMQCETTSLQVTHR